MIANQTSSARKPSPVERQQQLKQSHLFSGGIWMGRMETLSCGGGTEEVCEGRSMDARVACMAFWMASEGLDAGVGVDAEREVAGTSCLWSEFIFYLKMWFPLQVNYVYLLLIDHGWKEEIKCLIIDISVFLYFIKIFPLLIFINSKWTTNHTKQNHKFGCIPKKYNSHPGDNL